jgi:hypothetical protein
MQERSAIANPNQPVIKREAAPEIIESVRKIEAAADECYLPLSLLKKPANLAIWSLLTCAIVEYSEKGLTPAGSGTHDYTGLVLNASHACAIAIKWIALHGRRPSRLLPFRWTPSMRNEALEAFEVARNYGSFCACLPMWHRDRYAVQLLSPAHARFTVPGGARQRQVSAYQKGFRPLEGNHAGRRIEQTPRTPKQDALFQSVLNRASSKRKTSLDYSDPLELWESLLPAYRDGMDAMARRSPTLDLGGYTLKHLNLLFAALAAITAAHEFLCFVWGRERGVYPSDSAVIVKLKSEWIRTLARLSEVPVDIVAMVLEDLTLHPGRPIDIIVQPFVPLGEGSPWLAVAPLFPLKSRPDENILRILSLSKNTLYSEASNSKETELREKVKGLCSQFSPQGPRSLPQPFPDIDMILTDEYSSTIVLCEAKWIRKTLKVVEHIERDKDVAKGFNQLHKIRDYLTVNPRHLSGLKTIPKPIDQYENVHYILLARDHWIWREPEDNIAILEFDAFTRILSAATNLKSAMKELLRYEWMPVEGRDFIVRIESSQAANVMVDTEVFYALPGRQAISRSL